MKYIILAITLAFANISYSSETTKTTTKVETKEELKLIKASDLKKMDKSAVFVFDANDNRIREKEGIIPGAKALTGTRDYDLAILPTDKKANLVFYCGGPMCMASHEAAKRAINAGYANVTVMSDGIIGWKKAGYETEKYKN